MNWPVLGSKRSVDVVLAAYLLSGWCGMAQTGNTVVGPVPIMAAPGEMMTLSVQGVGSGLSGPVAATSLPLPTSLAGISVMLIQTIGPQSIPVPILSVRPVSTCGSRNPPLGMPCGRYVELAIQIPFELVPAAGTNTPNVAWLVVSENGVGGGAIEVSPQPDQIQSVLISHADGSSIYFGHPAQVGEELVMYVFGLGTTSPAVQTGQASPVPDPPTMEAFQLNFDHRPNASASGSYIYPMPCPSLSCDAIQHPVFAGLTAGFAGLYQVNFIVPTPPPGLPACSYTPGALGYIVNSNLTVSLLGQTSRGSAGICVDSPNSPGPAGTLSQPWLRYRDPVLPSALRPVHETGASEN